MKIRTSLRHASCRPLLHKPAVLRSACPIDLRIAPLRTMASLNLDDLFPIPPPQASAFFPERWPGVSASSTKALLDTVKDDYKKWHVFFNDKGFHNHTTHHLFALWALGGDAGVIRAAYEHNADVQRPAFESPGPIDSTNWKEHLGQHEYYKAYLEFFTTTVRLTSVADAIETYVMADSANLGPDGTTEGGPLMLVRFLDAVIHPIIHLGHGCEFGMLGMVAEGLAWTAVHQTKNAPMFPPSVFSGAPSKIALASAGVVSSVTSAIRSLDLGPSSSVEARESSMPDVDNKYMPTGTGLHAFAILGRALKDPLLAPIDEKNHGDLDNLCAPDRDERSEKMRARTVELSEEWAAGVDISSPGALEQKIEEIAWMNALTYGVGGASPDKTKGFYADFFLMHCVTSSLFLPSILHFLQPASQTRLLRAYFSVCFGYYIARGRPVLNLRKFFDGNPPPLEVPGSQPKPSKSALKVADGGTAHAHNAWHAVLQSTMLHPEAHVSKCERALAHWAKMYGGRPRGYWTELANELDGAEEMDGSLFVRAGALTLSKVGWVREGEDAEFWDQ